MCGSHGRRSSWSTQATARARPRLRWACCFAPGDAAINVCMLQFIKSTTSNYGENRAAKKAGIEIISLGGGFTWLSKDIEKDKALARDLWEQCKAKISSGDYDVVALDEFTYPLAYGWLPTQEVDRVPEDAPRAHARHHHRSRRTAGAHRLRRPRDGDARDKTSVPARAEGAARNRVLMTSERQPRARTARGNRGMLRTNVPAPGRALGYLRNSSRPASVMKPCPRCALA